MPTNNYNYTTYTKITLCTQKLHYAHKNYITHTKITLTQKIPPAQTGGTMNFYTYAIIAFASS